MANLTADKNYFNSDRGGRDSYVISNGVQLFAGALVGTNAAGFLDKWSDTVGHKFEGILLEGATGNTSATPPVEGRVNTSGVLLRSVTVASAVQANVNDLVYCATDNASDFSLSASTNVKAVGRVKRFVSAGVCDVQLFTPFEHAALN